jgi:hypothetical protein
MAWVKAQDAAKLLFAAVRILQLPGPRPEGKYGDHPVRTT